MVNTLLMATSIGKAKGHKPIAWRGSPNSYIPSEISTNRVFIPGIDKDFTTKLIVTSPQLTNYSLVLVQVNNFIARAYPCEVINCVNDNQVNNGITANNADDFKRILGSILRSQDVVTALQNPIAQTNNM